MVNGSPRSRRVATSGSSRCNATSRPIAPRRPATGRSARRSSSARSHPDHRSGRPAGPCRCRAAARPDSSRSGRSTSRAYRAADATVSHQVTVQGEAVHRVVLGRAAHPGPLRQPRGDQAVPVAGLPGGHERRAPEPSRLHERGPGGVRPWAGQRRAARRASHSQRGRGAMRQAVAAAGRGDPQRQRRVDGGRDRRPGQHDLAVLGHHVRRDRRAGPPAGRGVRPAAGGEPALRGAPASRPPRRRWFGRRRRSGGAAPSGPARPSSAATSSRSWTNSRSRRRPATRCSASRTSSSRGARRGPAGRQASATWRVRDAAQHPDVAQPAAGLLEVARPAGRPARRAGASVRWSAPAAPAAAHGRDAATRSASPRAAVRSARASPATCRASSRPRATLVSSAATARASSRVRTEWSSVRPASQIGYQIRSRRRPPRRPHCAVHRPRVVQQHQVEVAVRRAFPPAETTHRDQRHLAAGRGVRTGGRATRRAPPRACSRAAAPHTA